MHFSTPHRPNIPRRGKRSPKLRGACVPVGNSSQTSVIFFEKRNFCTPQVVVSSRKKISAEQCAGADRGKHVCHCGDRRWLSFYSKNRHKQHKCQKFYLQSDRLGFKYGLITSTGHCSLTFRRKTGEKGTSVCNAPSQRLQIVLLVNQTPF